MQQTKQGDRHGLFIRDTRPCREPAFVLARDRQLDNLERFCTSPSEFSVLTIDPTFDLGEFNVTPTTYHHQLLESVCYSTCPAFVGPSLVHYRKTFNTYLFFALKLVGLCKYKEVTLKKTMLHPIREQAGMGCSPQPFTENASESVNSMLKDMPTSNLLNLLNLWRNSRNLSMSRNER